MELITQFINDLGNLYLSRSSFWYWWRYLAVLFRMYLICHQSRHWFHCVNHDHKLMLEKMQPAVTGLAEATGSRSVPSMLVAQRLRLWDLAPDGRYHYSPLCCGKYCNAGRPLTDCVNVDVFNLHQNASMGALLASILVASCMAHWPPRYSSMGADRCRSWC